MERKLASKKSALLDTGAGVERRGTAIHEKATNSGRSSSFFLSPSKAADSAPIKEDFLSSDSTVCARAGGQSTLNTQRTPPVTKKGVSKRGTSLQAKFSSRSSDARIMLEKKYCFPDAEEATSSFFQGSTCSNTLQKCDENAFSDAETKRNRLSSSAFLETAPEDLVSLCKGKLIKYLWLAYRRTQPPLMILMDSFIISLVLMAALLTAYVLFVGTTFPRNAFVAALLSCGGTAVLTVSLRTQVSEKDMFRLSEERALADYLLCNLVLHYAVFSYLG